MSDVLRQVFVDSFVRGVGKTTGTLLTMFVGWQFAKLTYGHDDVLSFVMGKKSHKNLVTNDLPLSEEHEQIDMEDVEEDKYKSLLDKLF